MGLCRVCACECVQLFEMGSEAVNSIKARRFESSAAARGAAPALCDEPNTVFDGAAR